MGVSQWVKKLGGHAGELYVAAELSKRGIPNALLPENFSDDDILAAKKGGSELAYIQVKSCHPDRGSTFRLDEKHEEWKNAKDNEYVVFVWLGSPSKNESPKYWIASKRDVGLACINHSCHGDKNNRERRFICDGKNNCLNKEWLNNWTVFDNLK
jgi:hypothetical protein